ncbi:hypothetical protein NMY22_g18616 [Coprinellus aureogranulatus]|nr:hypothetical protein NMY22_g18616 [Coprinellus aureogranulatus]
MGVGSKPCPLIRHHSSFGGRSSALSDYALFLDHEDPRSVRRRRSHSRVERALASDLPSSVTSAVPSLSIHRLHASLSTPKALTGFSRTLRVARTRNRLGDATLAFTLVTRTHPSHHFPQ